MRSLVLFLICFATTVPAAELTGRITDPAGAYVSRAEISATNTATGENLETRSAADGAFVLSVTPGRWRITARAAGFREATSVVDVSDQPSNLVLHLRLPQPASSITVSEAAMPVDLAQTPGGTAWVPPSQIDNSSSFTLKDLLLFTPGVMAQSRWGADESQLSIRGSGLRNNFHLRGVNLLVNGLPYQDADGFSDFEALELGAVHHIDIWKGANALRFGGSTLGGAVNLVTPETGSPIFLRLEGGSYGAFKGVVSTAGRRGRFSYLLTASDSELEGYRDHSNQGRQRAFANLGWQFREGTVLRLEALYANVAEKLPGSLTLTEFRADPRQADPLNVQQDWGRFYDYLRIGARLEHRLAPGHELLLAGFGHYRSMDHPIFQVLDQDARNFGGEVRYRFDGVIAGRRHQIVVGYTPMTGNAEERRFANLDGDRGPLLSRFLNSTTSHGLYFEDQWQLASNFTLSLGGRSDWSERRHRDLFLADGDRSDSRRFLAFSPKVGFLWAVQPSIQVFGNVSRAYEPPLLLELTSFGAPGFLPLDAQDAWQFELGTRGSAGSRLEWDLAIFDWELEHELLNMNVQPFPGALFTIPTYRNAEKTRHLGFEAAGSVLLARPAGGVLRWRNAYTASRFTFVRDGQFTGNRLPGAPSHVLRSELRYQRRGWWVAPNLDWSPARYFVDSANTATNGSYAVLNLGAGIEWEKTALFLEFGNLAGRNYSASVQVDNALGRYYEPANGRTIRAGLRWRY
jgi:iron complex outermembrane recepter protein